MNKPKQSIDFFVSEHKQRKFKGYIGMYWGGLMNAFTSGQTTPQCFLALLDLANYIDKYVSFETIQMTRDVEHKIADITLQIAENKLVNAMLNSYNLQEDLLKAKLRKNE